ncbi:terpenoid synthase [Calocera viscosa TUFC12733]|uniref:Terpene synthase n=1 Tax=Calocera viscosa (strain TUFC12733) TaxID=1330018 RepID=A0A167NCN3_CALVF|nr:terpenoid synthase [Calocera viscosa TUFC12733]
MPHSTPETITIPDLLSYCDFPLSTNTNIKQCSLATDKWMLSVSILSDERKAAVTGIEVGLLASTAYPNCDLPILRGCADFLHWLFHMDDLTDDMGMKDASQVAVIVLDVLSFPDNFWTRMLPDCGHRVRARFIEATAVFFQGVSRQSKLRAKEAIPSVEQFLVLRRDDGGLKPCFALIEYAAGIDLPEKVMKHSVIKRLQTEANDLVVWSNDIFSFNKEQARGDRNNLVAVAMKEKAFAMQEAIDFVGEMCHARLRDFAEDRKKLPSWGNPIDRDVAAYVQGLADWVVATFHWSFASRRYFGDKGEEIKRHRVVELLPSRVPKISQQQRNIS